MIFRVSLLLIVALALVTGAFAIAWDDSHALQTAGSHALQTAGSHALQTAGRANPAYESRAQALPSDPGYRQIIAQAAPPAPELAAPVTTPDQTGTPDAAATPAPAAATPPAPTGTPSAGTATDNEPAPAATARPSGSATPSTAEPADRKPSPVVTAPSPTDARREPAPVVTAPPPAGAQQEPAAIVTVPPATDTPTATTSPDDQPTPVVTAPPPQTGTPAAEPAPVVAAPTPPEKPVIVMLPLPQERPDTSDAALAKNQPAKYLFGAKQLPSNGRARAIGYYPNGCLAGGVELAVDGPHWQTMRLSRNRNWGHPELVRFIERFAESAARETGWPGILVGDLSQPRGGPTPFGHRSHQTGLDVDIWFMPMPEKRLSRKQREKMPFTNLVEANGKELNPKTWTPETAKFIRAAAERPEVERVLVNAVIKKELCRLQGKKNWSWMSKVRPWYGHDDHIHVRLKCPADSPHCRSQPAVPGGDGCSNKELAHWFSDRVLNPKPAKHPKPRKQKMLADMPAACKVVLNAPDQKSLLASDSR